MLTIDFDEFSITKRAYDRGVKWALSFDGKTTDKDYSVQLPKDLLLTIIIYTLGNQCLKVMDKKVIQYMSLYIQIIKKRRLLIRLLSL